MPVVRQEHGGFAMDVDRSDAGLGDEGSLVVEDAGFAIVGEWVITAEISDGAFRVYSMLLRFGNSSGCRMPSRALLGRRLHRSVDSIDRAVRELVSAGLVRVEHRHDGRQYRSNRYYLRTSAPPAGEHAGGGRKSAATPDRGSRGGRNRAATPGRRSATRVAAGTRSYPETSTQTPPPPASPVLPRPSRAPVEEEPGLLRSCGIEDLDDVARRCIAARLALGRPTTRWARPCLLVAIKLAVVTRGWPPERLVAALLTVAADPETRSPARVAEAGPWWDEVVDEATHDFAGQSDMELRLDEIGGQRPHLQAQARAELAVDGLPLTRATVTRRACEILDRQDSA